MRTMRLSQLREAAGPEARLLGTDAIVSGITLDSRQVRPGDLYCAVVGERFNGHDFLSDAANAGAAAFVVERPLTDLSRPALQVPEVRAALAPLSCRFYENPTDRLLVAAVTGTNGKTTTVRMIDAISRAAGDKTGTIGTLGATIADETLPGERTTPEAPDLQRLLWQMANQNVKSVAIEVASHALALGRTAGCRFDVGVFTNLTQDHLDFHGTMENYQAAKELLFTQYADTARQAGKSFTAVLNTDDPAGRHYAKTTRADRTLTYAVENKSADIVAENRTLLVDRTRFTAKTPLGDIAVSLNFGGTFNIANALAAIGCGVARGLSAETIASGLARCTPVPGRFQPVHAGQDYAVLVDYAHTPDGLENVLRAARSLTAGRLIVVFGCGGNRDTTKRPRMGSIAKNLADLAVVTSDNPRRENPDAIIQDILAGMTDDTGAKIDTMPDRRSAIRHAVTRARPGDTIVLAGKGHEDYQEINDVKYPFDDAVVAAQEIAELTETTTRQAACCASE